MVQINKFCLFLELSTGAILIGLHDFLIGLLRTFGECVEIVELVHYSFDTAISYDAIVYSENIMVSMQLLFGIYLLYGSLKEKRSFIFGALVAHISFLAHAATAVVFALVILILRPEKWDSFRDHILGNAVGLLVQCFFVCIIYGRYEQMKKLSPSSHMEPVVRNRGRAYDDQFEVLL